MCAKDAILRPDGFWPLQPGDFHEGPRNNSRRLIGLRGGRLQPRQKSKVKARFFRPRRMLGPVRVRTLRVGRLTVDLTARAPHQRLLAQGRAVLQRI